MTWRCNERGFRAIRGRHPAPRRGAGGERGAADAGTPPWACVLSSTGWRPCSTHTSPTRSAGSPPSSTTSATVTAPGGRRRPPGRQLVRCAFRACTALDHRHPAGAPSPPHPWSAAASSRAVSDSATRGQEPSGRGGAANRPRRTAQASSANRLADPGSAAQLASRRPTGYTSSTDVCMRKWCS